MAGHVGTRPLKGQERDLRERERERERQRERRERERDRIAACQGDVVYIWPDTESERRTVNSRFLTAEWSRLLEVAVARPGSVEHSLLEPRSLRKFAAPTIKV